MDKLTLYKVKKKCLVLPLEKRLNIIELMDQEANPTDVARTFHVSRRTVQRIYKQKEYLMQKLQKLNSLHDLMGRKKFTGNEDNVLDKAIYNWFVEKRNQGEAVTGPLIKEMAKSLNEKLKFQPNFTASDGWFTRFKKRYGIKIQLISSDDHDSNCDDKGASSSNEMNEKLRRTYVMTEETANQSETFEEEMFEEIDTIKMEPIDEEELQGECRLDNNQFESQISESEALQCLETLKKFWQVDHRCEMTEIDVLDNIRNKIIKKDPLDDFFT